VGEEAHRDTQRLETDSWDLGGEENVGPLCTSGLQDPADHSLCHTPQPEPSEPQAMPNNSTVPLFKCQIFCTSCEPTQLLRVVCVGACSLADCNDDAMILHRTTHPVSVRSRVELFQELFQAEQIGVAKTVLFGLDGASMEVGDIAGEGSRMRNKINFYCQIN
jgi:hypothetical protein